MTIEWKVGMKLVHRAQPGWGVGDVVGLADEGRLVRVHFAGLASPVSLSTRDTGLVRHRFAAGDLVLLRDGRTAIVVQEAGIYRYSAARGLYLYELETEEGRSKLVESELRAPPPEPGPLAALRGGNWDPPQAFALRQEAVRLDLQRRGDALGALFASRVMVKPYQVSVVQRVLSARAPRFVLADEVGLGKTVEAGMVLSALSQSGLGRRLLVVAPGHLTLQWLAELYRKFNLRFTLLDGERLEAERKVKGPSPFLRFDRILTSLEVLARSTEAVDALCSPEGAPDLVVFDEAHHLAGARAFDAAARLARASWGVLFLTATPLALDQDEYFHLLQLLEPSAARDPVDFRARLERQGEVAALSRALLEGTSPLEKARALCARFPQDSRLAALVEAWAPQRREADRERLLEHLAEGYTLSTRLLRNRRAVVGGFPKRLLKVIEVEPSSEERSLWIEARTEVRRAQVLGRITGAVQSGLLRRLESSPSAAASALLASRNEVLQALAPRARALEGPEHDARYRAFRSLLRSLPADEKVLVFSEARETLSMLATLLERDGIAVTQYHGDLSPLERDRQVARFRDPEGPRVLLSSELGGEGRNFQFCRQLVHYDLPWEPSAVEQRIGRIDRVGQRHDMSIHVLRVEGTVGARVADLFRDAVGVFEQPVGGLDPVLDGVEESIAKLASSDDERAWDEYLAELRGRIERARAEIRDNFDPLLDRRSFDRNAVAALIGRGLERLNIDAPEVDESDRPEDDPTRLEEGLQLLSRELDERLEDVTVRLAQQAGIGVDTDEHVEAFECAFTLGREMNVEALPGLAVPEEPQTWLGSFWRDTAVEREEIEYFASGNRLVEALIGLARDGQNGRSTFRHFEDAAEHSLGFQFRFVWQLPEAEDVAAGAKVPSRAAARLLPRPSLDLAITVPVRGEPERRDDLLELLLDPDAESEGLRRDAVPLDRIEEALEHALARAWTWAQQAIESDVAQARARLEKDREMTLARTERRLARCAPGPERTGLEREAEEERAFFDQIAQAIEAAKPELDSVAGFLLG
jgi:ATP-dependent helicase HepA